MSKPSNSDLARSAIDRVDPNPGNPWSRHVMELCAEFNRAYDRWAERRGITVPTYGEWLQSQARVGVEERRASQ